MPRRRSVRAVVAEIVMFIGMFAIVAHLVQNLCERYVIHSEVNSMKTSLNALEMVINHIGIAYDNLREELQCYLPSELCTRDICPKLNAPITRTSYERKPMYSACIHCLAKKLVDVETDIEKNTKDFMQNFKRSTSSFMQYWSSPVQDEHTFTERVLKCTNMNNISSICSSTEAAYAEAAKKFCKCMLQCNKTYPVPTSRSLYDLGKQKCLQFFDS